MRYCPNCNRSYRKGEKDSCGLEIKILCPNCGAELNKEKPKYVAIVRKGKKEGTMFRGTKKQCEKFLTDPSGWSKWLGNNPRWIEFTEMVVNKI